MQYSMYLRVNGININSYLVSVNPNNNRIAKKLNMLQIINIQKSFFHSCIKNLI